MITLFRITLVALLIGGCSSIESDTLRGNDVSGELSQNDSSVHFQAKERLLEPVNEEPILVKNINHYVRGVMHNLMGNMRGFSSDAIVGVTSFAFIDSNLNESSLLGNQISESFMHELHQFGIAVVDYKLTGSVIVTEEGDFAFSRDYMELSPSITISYLLTGTLTRHQGGYLINARVVSLADNVLLSSAQGFIPSRVADAIVPHHIESIELKSLRQISLTQG